MRNVKNKTNFQHQKLKTLCTLDTSDIVISRDVKSIVNRKNPFSTIERPKTKTRSKSVTKAEINKALKSKQKIQHKSIERCNNTIIQTRSINTQKKPQKSHLKSRQHIKTQYDESSPQKITLHNLEVFTTVKNIKFYMDEKYNFDPFYVVNTIKSNNQETVNTVKHFGRNKKTILYIMKKKKYEQQIKMKQKLTDLFKPDEKKRFSCIYKVYRKDKDQNMYVVYHMQGEALSWKKNLCKKLIHTLPKNNMEILKHLIVEISKAIHILSAYGYYHSQFRLKNIFVELKQDEENVKVSKIVKLGNLRKCFRVNNKKSLEHMMHSIYTPPQILNLIMFEKQNKNFNRMWLEYIYMYEQGWRINVWSLGILILELLNEEPFEKTFIDLQQIIQFQKQIQLKCAIIFDKITDSKLQRLIIKMLSINPQQRPSPEHIILSLTA